MSFGGHVLDMVNRMKANDALRKSRRAKNQRIREKLSDSYEHHGYHPFKDKIVEREELERIKTKIRAELKIEQRNNLIRVVFLTILFSIGLYFIGIFLWQRFRELVDIF